MQGQEFYCKITKGFVRLLKFDQRHEILLNSKELFLVLNVDHYVLKCVLNYFEMEPGIKENDKPIPGFVKYVRIIMGLTIILIGSLSFYHFIFDNPSPTNEQGSFLYSMFYTLFIASGV